MACWNYHHFEILTSHLVITACKLVIFGEFQLVPHDRCTTWHVSWTLYGCGPPGTEFCTSLLWYLSFYL